MKYLAALIFTTLCFGAFAKTTYNWQQQQQQQLQQQQQPQVYPLGDADIGVAGRCDYHCTLADLPTCSSNGECMHQFHSPCHLSAYNCKHPQKPFQLIEQWRCEESWAPRCRAQQLEM